jgi:hypothetical protein
MMPRMTYGGSCGMSTLQVWLMVFNPVLWLPGFNPVPV